jgi:RNA polymerase sigma factor (sigma-70 family)
MPVGDFRNSFGIREITGIGLRNSVWWAVDHRGRLPPHSEVSGRCRMPPLDEELLQRGSDEDFEVLNRRHNERFIRWAFQRLGGRPCAREVAEEIGQDIWVRIHDQRQSYDSKKASFTTWAHSIVRNAVVDHVRRNRNQTTAPIDKIDEEKLRVAARDTSWLDEFRSDFADCLQRLPNDPQQVFVSVIIDGEEQKNVAQTLGLPEATAFRRKRTALVLLRDCLQSKGWTGNESV